MLHICLQLIQLLHKRIKFCLHTSPYCRRTKILICIFCSLLPYLMLVGLLRYFFPLRLIANFVQNSFDFLSKLLWNASWTGTMYLELFMIFRLLGFDFEVRGFNFHFFYCSLLPIMGLSAF